MRNIKIVLEYDGTNYHGFQRQRGEVTIQEVIEDALSRLTSEDIKVNAAGRTDAGVHAIGQVVNFKTSVRIPGDRFAPALNSMLPRDVVVVGSEEVDKAFHARFDAKSKLYRYTILNRKYPSALLRNHAYFYPYELQVERMNEACKCIVGTHDFRSFCAAGSSVKSFVRTVEHVGCTRQDGLIVIDVQADGFLYNMVRIIAGTLIEVGRGKLSPDDVREILGARDRNLAGPTAPASGLCLIKVSY